ncbi:Efflux pump mlcE [Hyphodiscus hymeniophilus]|uniref:Efflux pump mlcE n=1 Tax=Hyphodiscus hymeniophilus TaxID=353542 RepID=A0A9P6SMW2_9HELO|nr:Efflux pump mlcE [Hyphodiscus hymeniophilus]
MENSTNFTIRKLHFGWLTIASRCKITFFVFIIIFEVGSLICGVAPSSTALVVGRAVAGIGGAGIFSGATTIVGTSAPKEMRAQIVAFVYVFSMIGSVVSPIIGGALTERASEIVYVKSFIVHFSYRTKDLCHELLGFYINLPAGAVTLIVLSFVRIPKSKEKATKRPTLHEAINRLDPIGFVLFASFCVMLLLALQYVGSTYPWNSSAVIGLFVGAGVALIVFVFWEHRRGDTAMAPLSILLWFQTILGVNPVLSGAYFMATATTLISSTIITGLLSGKLGSPTTYSIVGNTVSAIGGGLIGYQVLAGAGRGMTVQQPVVAVQHTLDRSQMAIGASMVIFSQFFGGAIMLAVAVTDFRSSLITALKRYAPEVNADLIMNVGAAGVRKALTSQQLPGVLEAYNHAITNTFYLGCAASGAAFLASWGMGFAKCKRSHPVSQQKYN